MARRHTNSRTAQQISTDTLATAAISGVARALEARLAAGVALSPEELAQVHGGATAPEVTLQDMLHGGSTWGMYPSTPKLVG